MDALPGAYGDEKECGTLEITLADNSNQVVLQMFYTVFEATDVITRRVVLENRNDHGNPVVIRRLMSMMLDIPNRNFRMVTFDGGWIKEANRHDRMLEYGIYVNSSISGASSNRHNPGFLLAHRDATERYGQF